MDQQDQNYNTDNTGATPPEQPGQGGQEQQPHVWRVPPQQEGGYQPPFQSQQETPSQGQPADGQQPSGGPVHNGWQGAPQQPRPEKPPYQWDFDQYEQARAARPKHKKRGLVVFAGILGVILAVSLVSMASIAVYTSLVAAPAAPAEPQAAASSQEQPAASSEPQEWMELQDQPQEQEEVLPDGKLTNQQIIRQVSPSVVAITSYVQSQGYQATGMGSGIILREDGYIVTNAHVVEGAMGISVQLSDGKTSYEARVIGADTQTDLAVIKVDATGLTAASFGNSDQVEMGDKVLAIGNPQSMAFAGSVTEGIVSGLNRQVSATDQSTGQVTHYKNLIQTDAAINPGNSGGALVNEYGQVIGINSAKVIATGAEGIGFAIPSNMAQPIVDDLINYGRVTGRVMLGITAQEINEVQARLNQVPTGLLVISTQEGSDISQKGIIPGDIITKVNDKEITVLQDLTDELEGKKPGDQVKLEVYRPSNLPGSQGSFFEVEIALMEDTGEELQPQQEQPQQEQPRAQQDPYGWYRSPFFWDFFG